jgi:hypothetical protein
MGHLVGLSPKIYEIIFALTLTLFYMTYNRFKILHLHLHEV